MKKIALYSLCLVLFFCSKDEETQAPTSNAQTITPEPETVVVQYTLTVTAGEGGTVSTEGGTFDEGTEVNITATPDQGYEFVGWEQSNSNSNSLTITINSDISMLAIFLEAQNNNYWPLSTIQTLQNNYDGVKNKNSYWFEESEMNYLASENFIVWWDKDYDYLSRANSVLEMYEGIMQLTIDNGWGIPYSKIIPGLDSSNHLMSLYIYTYNDSSILFGGVIEPGVVVLEGTN